MPRKKRCPSPFELMDDDFDDTSSQSSRNGNPPIQRNAANARERARMRVLSSAFGRLKTKLPNIPPDTKLSKLDTLRLATMYIKQLKSVVEGGTASPIANSESTEGSFDQSINQTSCYLNLNVGAHGMNWPFGFHHFSHSPLIRSSSAMSLINNNSSSNNWCSRDNAADDQIKHAIDDTENYEHHHQHQHQHHDHLHQKQTSLFMNDSNIMSQQNSHLQHSNWYSEPSSPELDTATSRCLTFEASHFQHQAERHRSQNHIHNLSHQQYHNVSHIQCEPSHSSTFQFRSDFQNHHTQQHEPSAAHHLHHNAFVNPQNFQSTSIR